MEPQQNMPAGQPPAPANAAPQQQATAPMPPAPSGKKMNKNVLIAIIVAAVLVLAGAAWAVYAMVVNSPDNLLKTAMQNFSKEKQFAATMKIVNGTDTANTSITGDIAVMTDPQNAKNAEFIVGMGEGDERFSFSGLVLDKILYFKLSGAENLSALLGTAAEQSGDSSALASPQFATMLQNVNDQWFELKQEDAKSLAGSAAPEASVATATPEDLKKVMDLYNNHPFIKVDKTYADETVNGANSAHFSLKFDKNEYVAFMQAVKNANLASIKVTDKDIDQVRNQDDPFKDTALEVWIARDTTKLTQVRAANTKKGEEFSITMTMSGTLPTFDKFEKPADAKPISELITMMLGATISQTQLEAMQYNQSSEMYLTQ